MNNSKQEPNPIQKIDSKNKKNQKTIMWASLVLIVGIISRVVMYLNYPPVAFSDTGSYRSLSISLFTDIMSYGGTRLPGYPFFIGLLGSDNNVYLAQLIMGLISSFLFFWITRKITGNDFVGAIAGIAQSINLNQIFFEANLITETLTTFMLAIILLVLVQALKEKSKHPWIWWLLIGILGALTGLIRPVYFILPFILAAYLCFIKPNGGWQFNWRSAIITGLPALLITGAWIGFIYFRYGFLSVTTMNGFYMMQHVGNFFEKVPDEYAEIRDTYLKYRDERIATTGSQSSTIWTAMPEMQEVSGLGMTELSHKLEQISIDLIKQYPLQYLKSVSQSWLKFWRAPIYWDVEQISNTVVRKILTSAGTIERLILMGLNLIFVLISVPVLFWKRFRETYRVHGLLCAISIMVLLLSVAQALVENGENPRFMVPTQSWVIIWIAALASEIFKSGRIKFINLFKKI